MKGSVAAVERAPEGFVKDPRALSDAVARLEVTVAGNPRAAEERMALAEGLLRQAMLTRSTAVAVRLLERAHAADPYRAAVHLAHGALQLRAGAFDAALIHFDHAVLLEPEDSRARLHRGLALLETARRDGEAERADLAFEDFEWVLGRSPTDRAAMLGAFEAVVHGKSKRLREGLTAVVARIPVEEPLRRAMTRLFYQVIFAFGVGSRKNIDASNKKSMTELTRLAEPWVAAFPQDARLRGVLSAAVAKTVPAEELCGRAAEFAKEIPDVRVLRLLLRERLADVADPVRRLALFEGVIARLPLLDGIAQDFLQLVHLVAKRATAEGDIDAARAAWDRCLSLDPDNPSTVHNLARLAESVGDLSEAARRERQLSELSALYARFSPRADQVLARAAARLEMELERETAALREGVRAKVAPACDQLLSLVRRAARGFALARLAVDPSARQVVSSGELRELLDPSTADSAVFAQARRLLAAELPGELPTLYAWLCVAKDVPEADLRRARDRTEDSLRKEAELLSSEGRSGPPLLEFLDRWIAASKTILDPILRSGYDLATLSVEFGEVARRFHQAVLPLMQLAVQASESTDAARHALHEALTALRCPMFEAYLTTDIRDAAWVDHQLLEVFHRGTVTKGHQLLNEGSAGAVVDLVAPLLETTPLPSLFWLYASAALEDPRSQLWAAVEEARAAAVAALRCLHWGDPPEVVADLKSFAERPIEHLAQQGASWRARRLMNSNMCDAALRVLWSAYPGKRTEPFPNYWPAVSVFAPLLPAGRALYAMSVAQVIRESIIVWHNALEYPTFEEMQDRKRKCLALVTVADAWLAHADRALDVEVPSPADFIAFQEIIMKLAAKLADDRRRLQSM